MRERVRSQEPRWPRHSAEAGRHPQDHRAPIELSEKDPRTVEIFKSHDMVRLNRTLFEQFCFILNAGCDYSGRDMAAAHKKDVVFK